MGQRWFRTAWQTSTLAATALFSAGHVEAAPTAVFLIDQAGGMTSSCGSQSCWDAVRAAVQATLATYSGQVDFGVATFGGDGGATCPILASVPPGSDSGPEITSLLTVQEPGFPEKPLADAIAAAAALAAEGGAPRSVIATFRGLPDTCAQPSPNQGEAAAIAAAQQASALGVRVVVVSIGNLAPASFLQDLANAGAGLPIRGSESAPFYIVLNASELSEAYDGGVGSGLGEPVPSLMPLSLGGLVVGLAVVARIGSRMRDAY